MRQKLKIFFSNLVKSEKTKIFTCPILKRNLWFGAFLFFLIFGLFLPAGQTWAGLPQDIGNSVANVLITLVLGTVLALSSLWVGLTSLLLGWVTSPSFISVSFTGPDNLFVSAAWGLMRDLANMGFVIVLVAIGLGTALRIGEYQAKKTLPLLIAIALFINFTPVICGVIIDASNIIMNFFLGGGKNFTEVWSKVAAQAFSLKELIKSGFWNYLGMILGMIAFNFVAGFVFLLFAFLFAIRYVALWILVILSPFAFFSLILPATKRFWNMWWNQFIQWSFVGLTAAFFLYLTDLLMKVSAQITGPLPPTEEFKGLSVIFSAYLIPIIFLGVGLLSSLSIGATGASQVIGFTQKAAGWAKTAAMTKAGTWTRERMPKGAEAAAKRLAEAKTPGVGEKGLWAGVKRTATAAPWALARMTGRELEQRVGRVARKGEVQRNESAAEKIQDESILLSEIQDELVPGGSTDAAIGLMSAGIKKGKNFKKILEQNISPEAALRLIRVANEMGAVPQAERIARTFVSKIGAKEEYKDAEKLRLAMGFDELSSADEGKGYKNIKDKLIGEAKGDELKDFARGFWESSDALKAIQNFWGGPQLRQAAEEFGRDFVDAYMEKIDGMKSEKDINEFIAKNPRAAIYLAGNAAQDFGYRAPEGSDLEKMRVRIRKVREEKPKWTPEEAEKKGKEEEKERETKKEGEEKKKEPEPRGRDIV